jgi:hypothetical protein
MDSPPDRDSYFDTQSVLVVLLAGSASFQSTTLLKGDKETSSIFSEQILKHIFFPADIWLVAFISFRGGGQNPVPHPGF